LSVNRRPTTITSTRAGRRTGVDDAEGHPMSRLSRRTFLRTSAAGATIVVSGAAGAPWATGTASRTRVYVLVVDGCRPDEVTSRLTPRMHELRRAGRWFPRASSLPAMETIPYHVMMMTGVRPNRSGVPANEVYDRVERTVRVLDRPSDLRFPTVLERLRRHGLTTGTVLSKDYLYGIFGARATTMDVAATVGAIFGLPPPHGGYDGASRL
jgi:Type I phosphodiesterase / nucleotide pyrophosphatase